ncbi:MAG: AraC family transcriptional regulator [Kiritimatiellae bacterium]|nr:AraC family transcriptional regulator [Kiritimatiellia bacterium]
MKDGLLTDISKLSGFASPQYFSRFFKNRIGMTAEEFRSRNGEMW